MSLVGRESTGRVCRRGCQTCLVALAPSTGECQSRTLGRGLALSQHECQRAWAGAWNLRGFGLAERPAGHRVPQRAPTGGLVCTGGVTPVPYRRSWPGRLVPGEVDELREACSERTVLDEVPHVGPREAGHAIAPVGDADVVTMERGALFAADRAGLEEQRVGRVRRRRAHRRLDQRTRCAL